MSAALDADLEVHVGGSGGTPRFVLQARLQLPAGVLVLVGPSGAGKSLALQALAGLVRPAGGHVRVAGTLLSAHDPPAWVPPHRRGIGWVPQHHALFPFTTVLGNVLFGLPRAQRRRGQAAVQTLLDELGIAHLAQREVAGLSGGERQRVSLARALAVQPRLLLLDEPFAALDQDSRVALRGVLRTLLARRGTPAVFVTHDADEASAMADRITCLRQGQVASSGTVAEVLGPAAGVLRLAALDARAEALPGGRARLHLAQAVLEGPAAALPAAPGPVDLDLRPAGRRPGPGPAVPPA
jgi:ABC-type sulfate/molybdate transport systems ATPase subunit